ncbi:MAG: hypothetical protein K9J28_07275 [Sulfuritalea sp.]|nr:hypothetical protein [Sulfuritalea sp.]
MCIKLALLPKSNLISNTFSAISFDAANDQSNMTTTAQLLSSKVFRVTNIVREDLGTGSYRNEATLFCSQASIKVDWIDKALIGRIHIGQIVSPRLSLEPTCSNGCIRICRLVVYERPTESVNLFDLIPYGWAKDRDVVKRGAELMNELSNAHRLLFNAIFWNHARFERFCKQPSSMIGHHSEPSGNLRHTVEVAEEMRDYCSTRSFTNMHLGVLSAFLHDAGKADEYTMNDKGGWDLTDRGRLLGHKVTAVEWIAAAVATCNIELPQDHYVGLLHIFTAIPNAPDWMGLREPAMHESFLLSVCDRLSGRDDLVKRTAVEEGGFGKSHRHLKASVFTVRG